MSEQKNKRDIRKTLPLMRDAIKHLLLHNGWLKLIAIVISLCLWAGLISQDESITRDKSFQDVRVAVQGTEIMKNNGYIVVTDLEGLTADFTAAVPQKQYEAADPSIYNVRLDLSRINQTGSQKINIDKSYSKQFGKVTSITPDSVIVEIEKYLPKSIPIRARLTSSKPDGIWYVLSCEPTTFMIRGPESVVKEVSYARADIDPEDIDWSEGQYSGAFKFKLFNRAGEEIDTKYISITSANIETDNVIVTFTILPEKMFYTSDLIKITGTPAKGYKVTNVRISPETIKVADTSDILDEMDTLYIDNDTVNIDRAKDDVTTQIQVYKPTDNSQMVNGTTITVTVDIEPAEEEP